MSSDSFLGGGRGWVNDGEIKVSVICNAYNHEEYIRDAIEGILHQKTEFAFEVLIHDDASTDNTAQIIKEYEGKYPNIIKPIYQIANQYSLYKSITVDYQLPRANGEYIALCEGDDYWIDENKLQTQYDFLENNPRFNMCVHRAYMYDCVTKKIIKKMPEDELSRSISLEEIIYRGAMWPTASVFCRKSIFENPPHFFDFFKLDYTYMLLGAFYNDLYYMDSIMAVYRWRANNSWTNSFHSDKEKQRIHLNRMNSMLDILDQDTTGQYSTIIKKKQLNNTFYYYLGTEQYQKALGREFDIFLRELTPVQRLKLHIKAKVPWLVEILR